MSFIKDFKGFILKGNVLDLAVAVIIGAAFGKIVSSFVADIFMPILSILLGHVNFSELALTIRKGHDGVAPIVLTYGNFIQTTVDFLIIACAIFLVVKVAAKLKLRHDETPVAPAAPSKEEVLLTEIRDILKNNQK